MTRFSILLASTLAVLVGPHNAMANDPSLAADVQAMFGPTVSGAGPVTLVGTISRSMTGQVEESGRVTMLDTVSTSELVRTVSTRSSAETKWSPSPFAAQARQIKGNFGTGRR
jgi:hypothetical protein